MKTCSVIASIVVNGEIKRNGEAVDLADEVADAYEAQGYVDIISHDGVPVVWGACCRDLQ